LEFSADGNKVRRTGNASLPTRSEGAKKRDAKAEEKKVQKDANTEEQKGEEKVEEIVAVERDEQGRIIFSLQDFENTIIVHFVTKDVDEAADEEYKINWKDLETYIKANFDQVKVVYSRSDKYDGHLAISQYKMNKTQFNDLVKISDAVVGTKKFSFAELKGEDLKDFWQKQGGHFQYCIAPKLRLARKNQRKVQEIKREEKAKRQKQSYTIAGVYYMDLNKVKSKSRAILNIKKDGETLEQADADFMQELLKFHDRGEDKLKDLDHFEVAVHPEFNKTRCFFVVKKDGTKEDFSVSKCI
jgi:hypothetical protein